MIESRTAGIAAYGQPKESSSLSKDIERVGGRLSNTLERVRRIADMLHGSRPRGMDAETSGGKPESSVRNTTDALDRLCSEIDTEFSFIEDHL